MRTGADSRPQKSSSAWHATAADEVLCRLESDSQLGLSAAEALQRLETYGRNKLPEGRKQGPFMRLLFTYAPPRRILFETKCVPLALWPLLLLGDLVFFLVVEAEKLVIRKTRPSGPDAAVTEGSA